MVDDHVRKPSIAEVRLNRQVIGVYDEGIMSIDIFLNVPTSLSIALK